MADARAPGIRGVPISVTIAVEMPGPEMVVVVVTMPVVAEMAAMVMPVMAVATMAVPMMAMAAAYLLHQ